MKYKGLFKEDKISPKLKNQSLKVKTHGKTQRPKRLKNGQVIIMLKYTLYGTMKLSINFCGPHYIQHEREPT